MNFELEKRETYRLVALEQQRCLTKQFPDLLSLSNSQVGFPLYIDNQ